MNTPMPIATVGFLDGDRAFAVDWDGVVRQWDSALESERNSLKSNQGRSHTIRYAALTRDGRRVIATDDDMLVLWDLERRSEIARFEWKFDWGAALALSITPEGRRILAGGYDGSMRLYECQSM